MRKLFIFSGLFASAIFLTGALNHQSFQFDDGSRVPFVAQSAPLAANGLLQHVMANLGPERVQWLEMNVWQKRVGQDHFETEGRFLLGPGNKRRVELDVTAGGLTRRFLMVSDGKNLIETRTRPGEPNKIERTSLPQSAEEFLRARGLGGLWPLLAGIQHGLRQPTQQTGTWRGRRIIKVAGAWDADEDFLKSLPPEFRVRRCNLYLDAETLWPYRIEWLGSARPDDSMTTLLQMEFRDPVINRPMSAEQAAKEFGL
jgi:hypothetical protein